MKPYCMPFNLVEILDAKFLPVECFSIIPRKEPVEVYRGYAGQSVVMMMNLHQTADFVRGREMSVICVQSR